MFTVKTICRFSAAHRLIEPYQGKCNQLHGHTWKVEVVMKSSKLDNCGMVVDFKEIKNIVDSFDHRYLNDFISQPTAENIAKILFNKIKVKFFKPESVKVWESETSYAKYFESE